MDEWVARNLDHQRQHGHGLFSVMYKPDGLLVGDCGLERWRSVRSRYETRSDYWGLGLATEAASAVRGFAFTTLGRSRVAARRTGSTRSSAD
jgi:RimJ/RimL family protein N-acetyltransferase